MLYSLKHQQRTQAEYEFAIYVHHLIGQLALLKNRVLDASKRLEYNA